MKRFFPLVVVLSGSPVWAQNALSVRVVDAAGAPIAGAQVQVRAWSDTAPAPFISPKVTDASGTVLFALPVQSGGKPLSTSIVAGAKGFAFNSAFVIGGKVEVRLERGVAWRGKIVDEEGKPLAGARVTLRGAMKGHDFRSLVFLAYENTASANTNPLSALYSTLSKADGSFVIENAPADKELIFQANRAGFALVNGQDARAGVEEQIKLQLAGSVHGRALGADGKPIANLKVYASGQYRMGGNGSTTDAKGAFTIGHLAPGTYTLSATLPDNATYLLARRPGVRVEGGKTGEVDIWRAQKSVVVRGMVRDAITQKPVKGASFAADNPQDIASNDDSAWATSDATGHFVLRVLPGKYQVRSAGAPSGYMRTDSKRSTEVDSQGKQSGPELNFTLQRSPIVRGIALDEGGRPIKAQLTLNMGGEIDTDANGKWQYTPQSTEDLAFGGGSDESGYFDVISPKRVDWPVTKPIAITVRHRPWGTLAGRIVTPEGTPIEGARVEGSFIVHIGDSMGLGAQSSATSDKDGRYVLTQLRDSRQKNVGGTDIKVSAKKDGYEFQSGGTVSHRGESMSVTDMVFVPLGGKIEGTTQAGAQIVVAGRETRADAGGHFAFTALPAGQQMAFAAKDDTFGSAPASAPLDIQLHPIEAQKPDKELAEQMWADIVRETKGTEATGLQEWLTPPSFGDAMKAAQAAGDTDKIAEVAARWKNGDSLEVLRGGLEAINQTDRRADSFLIAALTTKDAELMKRALEESESIFKKPTTDILWREPQLYRAAVLRERLNGAEDGRLALGRALAYTLQNHPEKSRIEGAMQTQVGRNEALAENASITAQGSPAMLREVLDSIDDGSGFEIRALGEAIPIVAQTHGFAAAQPLLTELKNFPAPTLDLEPHYQNIDPDWAYGQAVYNLIPLIGEKDPAKVLTLARGVEGDDQRAQALVRAAKFQTPTVAAPIYREAVKIGNVAQTPRIAAMVWESDPKLGQELFAVARRRTDDTMKSDRYASNLWIPFAFYSARANPAQARLILEREWGKRSRAKTDIGTLIIIATAMAPIDARRAMELARQIPEDDSGEGLDTRRKIARYAFADEVTRQSFVLDRFGSSEDWHTGKVEW
ncbi:hypothetical protein IAD21_04905 [Abditibacteriota bacterium]|nr:hypothetical protein IAD21_04905 [Abditibacteriota bacterium]